MQPIFCCTVATICTTWLTFQNFAFSPHSLFVVAWVSQTKKGFLLKDSKVGPCARDGVFTMRYELSFYLLCRRNTRLKDYKLEDVTNGDPD
jgi:hypothetical protein